MCACVCMYVSIYIYIYWALSHAWQLYIFSLLVHFLNLHNLLLCLISADVIPSCFMGQKEKMKKEFIYFLTKYLPVYIML